MSVLEVCRARLGSPVRSFPPELIHEIKGTYNPLLSTVPWDSLFRTFFDQTKLRERGEVVWAKILQANNLMFAPGLKGESHVATVLYGTPGLDDPAPLFEISDRIQSFATNPPNDVDRKAVQAMLHPSRRKYGVRVPDSLAGGLEVFCSDMLIFRKLLPQQPKGATLQKLVFPLLVATDESKMVMQVPSQFWPEEFLEFWESA